MSHSHSEPELVSEPILPKAGSFDTAGMGRGEAGLPHVFTWRDVEYTVDKLITTWKSSGPSGCGETYLRRHWFEVVTTTGERMTLYCERQARHAGKPKSRWWLYTIVMPRGGGN